MANPDPHVQTSYKLAPDTKGLVDLMSNALGLEKSAVIDEAVELNAREKRGEIAYFSMAQEQRSAVWPESGDRRLTASTPQSVALASG